MSPYDVIVIGSGAGGGTLVNRLAPSGKRIVGDHLLDRLGASASHEADGAA